MSFESGGASLSEGEGVEGRWKGGEVGVGVGVRGVLTGDACVDEGGAEVEGAA